MDWSRTVHALGDLHAGGIPRARVQRLLDDVQALPKPALHLQVGDATERGKPEQDKLALRWLGRAKAWLSGHTHSPLDAPGFVTRAPLPQRRSIVAVNCSALAYVGKKLDPKDPVRSLYLTHYPGRLEIRYRDHGAGDWTTARNCLVHSFRV